MTKERKDGRSAQYPKFKYIHIDCDPLVYRYGFSVQENCFHVGSEKFKEKALAIKHCTENGIAPEEIVNKPIVGPLSDAVFLVERKLALMRKRFKASRTYMYLSPRTNFRNDLWGEYKANRSGTAKPYHYDSIRQVILNRGAKIVEGFEADDVVGMNHFHIFKRTFGTGQTSIKKETLIIGEDKDFNNIPGWHYNPEKDKLFYVTLREAIKHFHLQMLMGDTADNVAGVPGIGEKKAAKILDGITDEKSLWHAVRETYLSYAKANNIDQRTAINQMLVNAHMLHILWEPGKFFIPPSKEDECENSQLLEKIQNYLRPSAS